MSETRNMRPIIRALLFISIAARMAAAHTTVTDTQIILHNGEKLPRYASRPGNNLVVPAGQTVTLPADATFDAIEVSGTLKVSREADTVLKFTNLQVLPGGVLDMGTTNDPVTKRVEFIVRDVPINTQIDPFQWGNGIFNLGTWTSCGRVLGPTWSQMEPAEAGATKITVVGNGAAGWQVGDELLIPDTRQMSSYPWTPYWVNARREAVVKISAIDGNQITLSKPLDFEHAAALSPPIDTAGPPGPLAGDYDLNGKVDEADRVFWCAHFSETEGIGLQADGDKSGKVDEADFYIWQENLGNTAGEGGEGTVERVVRYKPYVANASRNITIRSQNPNGARGHTVTTGDVGLQKLEYTALVDLGRTGAQKLNNSNGTVPGTNQVGRYIVHLHHVHAQTPSYHRGLAVINSPKWGIVTHGTHDTKTEWCVVDRCVGAGIVTEDGPEVRNTFERNFVMGSVGAVMTDMPGFIVDGKNGALFGQPGSEGAGLWFHGVMNRINGNVSMNNKIGINFVGFGSLKYNYPSQPGGPMDTPYDKFTAKVIEMDGNVTACNLFVGTEAWDVPVRATQLDCWHNGGAQIEAAEGGSFNLDYVRCLAQDWITEAIRSNGNYVWSMAVNNARFEGCANGILPAITSYKITNSTLYCKTNIDWRKSPGANPTSYEVNVLGIPGPGGSNFLIDWPYDQSKVNLSGSPYSEQPQ